MLYELTAPDSTQLKVCADVKRNKHVDRKANLSAQHIVC